MFYGNTEKIYLSDASKQLPYSAMTITRAAKQLKQAGLVEETKEGVNKIISSKYDKKTFYEKAKEYLISPVKKRGYIAKEQFTDEMLVAGENALAEMSMLGTSELADYAIFKDKFDKKLLKMELIDSEKQIGIELWQYDPYLFTDKKRVDLLSLAASLKDIADERIEISIEEVLEEYFGGKNGSWI